DHGRLQALLAFDQLLFVQLELGDVGADRNEAAVLGAPLTDLQPAAVFQLRLEGARAGYRAAFTRQLHAHDRLAAGRRNILIGRTRRYRLISQAVQALEFRVAQHEPIVGVP